MAVIPTCSPRVLLLAATLAAPVSAQQSAATDAGHDSLVAAIRQLGTAARSGPLKLAELRGLPLEDPAWYTLTAAVPDKWTCRVHIATTLVTARCRTFVPLPTADAEFAAASLALEEALGRKGWAREADIRQQMLEAGTLEGNSYEIKRDRRTVARATVSLTKPQPGALFPGGMDRMVTFTIYSMVNTASGSAVAAGRADGVEARGEPFLDPAPTLPYPDFMLTRQMRALFCLANGLIDRGQG
jgi:hypothetical protein